MSDALKVAVLGCGSVGSQVVRLLSQQAADLQARVGAPVELVGIAVRRLDAPRDIAIPDGLLTTDADGLVARDDHLSHRRDAIALEEHVLGATQPNALRTKLACDARVLRCVGVGPDAKAAQFIGPAENARE